MLSSKEHDFHHALPSFSIQFSKISSMKVIVFSHCCFSSERKGDLQCCPRYALFIIWDF